MKQYNRVMAGRQSLHAAQCFREGWIGVDYGFVVDFTGHLHENWREFNRAFVPVYLEQFPGKSKIAAGLACGFTWTLCKGLKEGDVVITPDGNGRYRAGEITGPYFHAPGQILPHRRPVRWLSQPFDRSDMSEELKRSTNSTGTCCDITSYAAELEKLIGGQAAPALIATDATVEDASAFAMETHLEDFLVKNWTQTELGREYDIYTEDGEQVGQQYLTDTGPLDILAVSKDKKRLLVVELKKGRASDVVVGQTLRYMGFVQEELAEDDQTVCGAIIALEDDAKLRQALRMVPMITFYRYQISFKLVKG
jgi:restriction system protein